MDHASVQQIATFIQDHLAVPETIATVILGTAAGDRLAKSRGVISRLPRIRPSQRFLASLKQGFTESVYIGGEAVVVLASTILAATAIGVGILDAGKNGSYTIASGAGLALVAAIPAVAVLRREILNRRETSVARPPESRPGFTITG